MNAADWIFTILFYVNLVMVAIVTISFVPQFLFYLFFFLKRRHFKEVEPQKRFAVLVCAHNEGDVIEKTVHHLVEEMNYPKELYKVYVCAHNCTDDTVEKARRAGAIVYEYHDDDPKHAMVSYPMRYALRRILQEDKEAEVFIRADADNIFHAGLLTELGAGFSFTKSGELFISARYKYSFTELDRKYQENRIKRYIDTLSFTLGYTFRMGGDV